MQTTEIQEILVHHFPALCDQELKIQRVSGMTNITYAVQVNGNPSFIFKVYSPGCDHEIEHQIASIRYRQGIGSKSFAFNDRYSIQEFILDARHPQPHEMVSLPLFSAIMIKLHKLHHLDITNARSETKMIPSQHIFSRQQLLGLLKFRQQTQQNSNNLKLQKMILQVLQRRQGYSNLLLPKSNQRVRVCHNDLNNLNMLVKGTEVFLIDYDYAAYNYLAYDIANLINQSCFDYSSPQFPGFECKKYFTTQQIYSLAQHYPGFYPELKLQVLKFMCVVNLSWAIWSLQRCKVLNSKTFGALEHGIKRMELFHLYKQLVLLECQTSI